MQEVKTLHQSKVKKDSSEQEEEVSRKSWDLRRGLKETRLDSRKKVIDKVDKVTDTLEQIDLEMTMISMVTTTGEGKTSEMSKNL